jgi:hypothetical protein
MRRMRVAAGAAVAALVLGACGGPAETSGLDLPEYRGDSATTSPKAPPSDPRELVAASAKALAAQDSVTVSGETGSGQTRRGGSMSFTGDAGTGSFSFGGGVVTLLYAGGQAFYKGDSAVYAAFGVKPEAITRRIGDKWIVVNSTNPKLVPLRLPASRAEFLAQLLAVVEQDADVAIGPSRQVAGTRTVALTSSAGTVLVSAETLLPVRLVLAGDEGSGIGFAYDEAVAAPAPLAPDQIVDLGDLR